MALLSFENIGLKYHHSDEVLSDINFELKNGSFHYLTGASGAGKTSMMRMLYLAQKPTRGKITLLDQDIVSLSRSQLAHLRRQIGIVFQDFRLLNHLSVFDNVALPLRIGGMDEAAVQKNVTELLNWVGLGNRIYESPERLSGGEQQRIAIARAVINKPKLLLADEPTGSVDPEIGEKLVTLFLELNKHGTTVIFATHDESIITKHPFPQLHLSNGGLDIIPAGIKTKAA